jgi:hypothetical protein
LPLALTCPCQVYDPRGHDRSGLHEADARRNVPACIATLIRKKLRGTGISPSRNAQRWRRSTRLFQNHRMVTRISRGANGTFRRLQTIVGDANSAVQIARSVSFGLPSFVPTIYSRVRGRLERGERLSVLLWPSLAPLAAEFEACPFQPFLLVGIRQSGGLIRTIPCVA